MIIALIDNDDQSQNSLSASIVSIIINRYYADSCLWFENNQHQYGQLTYTFNFTTNYSYSFFLILS